MTDQSTLEKQTVYSLEEPSDKHFFAAFLNLAMNNLENALQEFAVRINDEAGNGPEASIEKLFEKDLSITDWDKRIEILTQYLPVISYLDGDVDSQLQDDSSTRSLKLLFSTHYAKKEAFRENLTNIIAALNSLRNYYTHYHHDPIYFKPDNNNFYSMMDELLIAVAKDVKKQKKKSDKTREALNQNLEIDFRKRIDRKKEALRAMDQDAGRKIKERSFDELNNAVYNDAFKHILVEQKGEVTLADRYQSYPGSLKTPVSVQSLLFLCSCFLSRREMELMKARIKGYKGKIMEGGDSLKYMATHWVYDHLNFKGLKRKINTQFEKENLLAQIIDELSKVPDSLYRVIKDKEEFVFDINTYMQQRNDKPGSLNEETISHPIIRKRYEDKFNYLALRFLDEFARFENLRFQIHVGNYLHDRKDKASDQNNLISKRQIKEKINLFGKLSEVNKAKADFFKNNPQLESSETGWELFPNPSYNFNGGSILIQLNLKEFGYEKEADEIKNNIKKAGKRDKRLNKNKIVSKIFEGPQFFPREATALLSLNELPALLHDLLVEGKGTKEIEQIIADRIVTHYRKIRDFTPDPEQKTNSELPANLIKGANKDSKNTKKLKKAIENDLEETQTRLNQIENNKRDFIRKKRKHVFFLKEKGEIATWLANDIKRFMPKETKEHWKSYDHNEFQKGLAFYEAERKNILALIEAKWDMNAAQPFWGEELKKQFLQNGTFVDFYKNYNSFKIKILLSFRDVIENTQHDRKLLNKALKDIFIPYKERLYRMNNMEKEKAELLKHPVVLPRGLFDKKPTFIKGTSLEENPSAFAKWMVYYRSKSKESHQKFYDFERDYRSAYNQVKENKPFNNYEHFTFKTDLSVRRYMQNDVALKLIAQYLLESVVNESINIKLDEVYLTKAEIDKQRKKAKEQHKRLPGDKHEIIYKEDHIFNKTFEKDFLDGRLHYDKLRLKDFGKAQRFAADEKVQTLISYSNKIWSQQELESELYLSPDSYERIRQDELLKRIHELEKVIWNKHKDEAHLLTKKKKKSRVPSFNKYIATAILKQQPELKEEEYSFLTSGDIDAVPIDEITTSRPIIQKAFCLILIRNKFSHNQLPEKDHYDFMRSKWKKTEGETHSRFLMKIADSIVGEFLSLV